MVAALPQLARGAPDVATGRMREVARVSGPRRPASRRSCVRERISGIRSGFTSGIFGFPGQEVEQAG